MSFRLIVRLRLPLLVDRTACPRSPRLLVLPKPLQSFPYLRIVLSESGCLEYVQDEPGGVSVGSGFLRAGVAPLKLSQRSEPPTTIWLLPIFQLVDDFLPLFGVENSVEFRRCP